MEEILCLKSYSKILVVLKDAHKLFDISPFKKWNAMISFWVWIRLIDSQLMKW